MLDFTENILPGECRTMPFSSRFNRMPANLPAGMPVFAANGDGPAKLLRQPAVSADHVAFVYANDIWITGRDGGDARRLTTFVGAETLLGPVYVGYGYAEGGHQSLYVFLGRSF